MKKWLIIHVTGFREIVDADDLYDLHNKIDDSDVVAVIRLDTE